MSVKLWKTNTVLKIVVVMLQSNLKEKFLWYSFVDIHGMKRYGSKTVILLNLYCEVVKNETF